jgi:tripartite-type tricarboxylate transporter receptor subunit TctC
VRKQVLRMPAVAAMIALLSIGIHAHGADNASPTSYPNRPIRLITPAPPGGTTDLLARLLGPRLAEALKHPIVIDNRGGAGGVVAAEITARAPPDGYTLLLAYSSHTTNVSLNPKAAYRTVDDYQPITQVTSAPLVLVVNPQFPVNSARDIIAYGKANANKLNFSSAGNDSGAHMSLELFKYMTGLPGQHISYKGMGPAVVDLLGGQVQAMFAGMLPIEPLVRAGRVRALAVTSLRRCSALPDLPTIAETGVPGYDVATWYGILAPAGIPKPIVDRLNKEIVAILMAAEVRQRLQDDGADVVASTPAAFEKMMRIEVDKWAKVVKTTGARFH